MVWMSFMGVTQGLVVNYESNFHLPGRPGMSMLIDPLVVDSCRSAISGAAGSTGAAEHPVDTLLVYVLGSEAPVDRVCQILRKLGCGLGVSRFQFVQRVLVQLKGGDGAHGHCRRYRTFAGQKPHLT